MRRTGEVQEMSLREAVQTLRQTMAGVAHSSWEHLASLRAFYCPTVISESAVRAGMHTIAPYYATPLQKEGEKN